VSGAFWPAGVPRAIGAMPATMADALRRATSDRPDHVAIAFYGFELRYAELLVRVERLAAFLQHRCGISHGDRVLLDMQNSPHFVIAFHAIIRAGGVVVPANPMYVTEELAFLCRDSGAAVALVGAELIDRVVPLVPSVLRRVIAAEYAEDIPQPRPFALPPVMSESILPAELPDGAVPWAAAMAETAVPLPDRAGPDDLCVMPYTSGTTGRPKACMHTHAAVVFTAVTQILWYRHGSDGVLSAFMPMFHVTGMQVSMNGAIAAGVTMVIMTRWDRELITPLFLHYGVTFWSAAPTMIVDVIDAPGFDPRAFDRLRLLTGGGAPMPAALAAELERRWGLRFVEGYGLTESMAPLTINPPDRPKPQCLGIPIHCTDIRIVSPETGAELGDGEVGEIVAAGPQIMRGYWKRPDADTDAFLLLEGTRFLRTGDLGYRDADGYLYAVDRLKRMINVSGFKVWPAETESVLFAHPAIRECCIISVPDPYRGETVKAFVVLRPGASVTADALIGWARDRLAAYKVPRLVEFVDVLPRSSTGKVDWRRLQDAERARAAPPP
jgi:fatty-acyl-CoA synthase